ncbi:MAG TPA: hypothetical protein VGM03_20445 [Phycisphaerae bacterium]|jgi:hypothetical protein
MSSVGDCDPLVAADDTDDLLRLKQCPICGYSLRGLPRRHRCPECGFEYDECMFVLEFRDPRRLDSLLTKGLFVSFVALLALLMVLRLLGRLAGGGWIGVASVFVLILLATISVGWRGFRSKLRDRRRVFFAADGIRWMTRAPPASDSLDVVEAVMELEDAEIGARLPPVRAKTVDDLQRAMIQRALAAANPLRVRRDDVWGGILAPWSQFRGARLERGSANWHRLHLARASRLQGEMSLGWFECSADDARRLQDELTRRVLAARS